MNQLNCHCLATLKLAESLFTSENSGLAKIFLKRNYLPVDHWCSTAAVDLWPGVAGRAGSSLHQDWFFGITRWRQGWCAKVGAVPVVVRGGVRGGDAHNTWP